MAGDSLPCGHPRLHNSRYDSGIVVMDTQFHVNFAKQETKILTKFRQGRRCLVRVDPEGAGDRGGPGRWDARSCCIVSLPARLPE